MAEHGVGLGDSRQPVLHPHPRDMQLIEFGYDKDPKHHQRGITREDRSLTALDYTRYGLGWQMCDLTGNRWGIGNRHYITREEALQQLMEP